ncbi:MAG: hypothetical protein IJJ82_03900 [Clostridia bacterium]|nr:hypothetical protein [Clostridia bacterium]
MEERKIVLDQAIPENYSMLKITVFNNDVLEIGVVKVINTYCITKYIGCIKSDEIISENFHFNKITYKELEKAESLDVIMPKVLDIIGNDTIIYLNSNEQMGLLKSKCENLGIQINNNTIDGAKLLNQIPRDIRGFVCNSLDILDLF